MTENVQLMRDAKATLTGKWGYAALTTLVYTIIITAASMVAYIPFIGWAAALLIGGPMWLGYIFFIISLRGDKENLKIETLFSGFKQFTRAFITYLLMMIFVVLWMILLIVPGIIMAIAYSMTFFIIAEDKDISAYDAIMKSKQMMYGYKWKYFCLNLRFLGWVLLCILTLGIGFFWLQPYMEMSYYNFYLDIKDNPIAKPTTERITTEVNE